MVLIMAPTATKTLNIRIPAEQYEELEEMVKARHFTSKGEYMRQLLRESLDEYSVMLHEKAERDRGKYVPLRDYGKRKGLE